jgi:oxaloacetate decarboxylase gamma subunit
MTATLLAQGLELLIYGMGTVVVFLLLLVYATGLMSQLILRFFPEPPQPAPRRTPASLPVHAPVTRAKPVTPELLAAIAAAVHQHRCHEAKNRCTQERKLHV